MAGVPFHLLFPSFLIFFHLIFGYIFHYFVLLQRI